MNVRQLLRFGMMGGVNTLLGILLVWVLATVVGVPYPVAHVAVHILVVSLAYVPSSRWVFDQPGLSLGGLGRFHGAYLVQLLVSTVLLVTLVGGLGLPLLPSQFVAIVFAVLTSYLLQRFFVFAPPRALGVSTRPERMNHDLAP